jgi:putative ubiquitin-RnfH superfamily antitoxin RatB of RatAB toxin-antitoxin module
MVDGRPLEIGLKASAAANSKKLKAGERTLIVAVLIIDLKQVKEQLQ